VLTAKSERVRQAHRLDARSVRRKQGRFLAEGPQAVREALRLPDVVVEVLAEPGVEDRHPELRSMARAADVPWYDVDTAAVELLSDTVTSQGVVAVCRLTGVPLDAVSAQARLLAVGVQVRDPGNVGTLIRCADAAGADAVVLSPESVDPHNPKAVRASAGSLFHLAVVVETPIHEAVAVWRERGIQVLAADGDGDTDLDDLTDAGALAAPTAWLFGNEAHGLPEAITALADRVVRVPIHGRAESLNLATAAAVCLYASARAHRRPEPVQGLPEPTGSPPRGGPS
jgi:RNA methyltransferase, TrmH family